MFEEVDFSVEGSTRDAALIVEGIKESFVPTRYDLKSGTRRDKITRAIFGSKRVRPLSLPDRENTEYMQQKVQRWIDIEAPIEFATLWGALKGYGQGHHTEADVMDLIGLRRYGSIARAISSVYNPGVKITIIVEDLEELSLASFPGETEQEMEQYVASLDSLCSASRMSNAIKIRTTSDILTERGLNPEVYFDLSREFAKLLQDYWMETKDLPESQRASTETATKLKEAGWIGGIAEDSRTYFIGRASTEFPDLPLEDKIALVCKSLATALTRKELGVFQSTYQDDQGGIDVVRTSFVLPPPGLPRELGKGRAFYRLKDSKSSNKHTPPWCGYGFMEQRNGLFVPTLLPLPTYRSHGFSFEPVTVLVSNDQNQAAMRADVLHR